MLGGRGGGVPGTGLEQALAERLRALDAQLQAVKAEQQAGGNSRTPEQQAKLAAELSQLQRTMAAVESGQISLTDPRAERASFPLASMTFDPRSPVTIKGVVTRISIVNPSGVIWVDPKDRTGKQYEFLTAGVPAMARQGLTIHSLNLGDEVTINGVLAVGGQPASDGAIAARADTVTAANGRKLSIVRWSRSSCTGITGEHGEQTRFRFSGARRGGPDRLRPLVHE